MKIRFNIGIISAILLFITAMTAAVLTSVWVVSSETAEMSASSTFNGASGRARERVDRLLNEVLVLANLGATQDDMTRFAGDGLNAPSLPLMYTALSANPELYSLYYGFVDGRFLQVIATHDDRDVIAAHQAPEGTSWIVRAIFGAREKGAHVQTWTFLDAGFRKLSTRQEPLPKYDPRERPWYKGAMVGGEAAHAQLSEPYVFSSLQQPGITASRVLSGGHGVFGVDLTLTSLTQFVSKLEISANGGLVVLDPARRAIAASSEFGLSEPLTPLYDLDSHLAQALNANRGKGLPGKLLLIDEGGETLLAQQMNWTVGGVELQICAVAPMTDFTDHIIDMQMQIVWLSLLGLATFVSVALLVSNRMSKSVANLAEDAERVRRFDFSGAPPRPSVILEFDQLGKAFTRMKEDLASHTQALEVAESKLNRLVTLGVAMSSEHNTDKLVEMILRGAKEITHADGGTVYIMNDNKQLEFKMMLNDTLDVALGGESGDAITVPPVELFDENGKPNRHNVVSYTVHTAKTINIADAYHHEGFDFSGTRKFDENNDYRSKSFLTVPLRPRGGEVIGAVQLINALPSGTKDANEAIAFSPEMQDMAEALSAQAATALYNLSLLEDQEKLMDSFIQLMAGAIDAKSPYTGGHCARVPELAIMLAEKASDVSEGSLGEFYFENDDQWREFRIGAWLHDSGKVITPEYVVDKATKLETIYNRIHEVRTRFEVLLRDAQIARLEAIAGGADEAEADRAFEQEKAQLLDDFHFLAEINVGGEHMEDDALERLTQIASRTWMRNFNDRIGLSHGEMLVLPDEEQSLPAVEKLLSDKKRHIVARDRGLHDTYENLDFKVDIPEHLYNRGEMHNLSVTRGTLTIEERFKITEHIMQTIAMLERLPFPKHLARVPEYAGTHHETLGGTGYPRKLTKDELSVPSRIMAIADIFEALTASDRPYKKPKSLSEAIKILSFFKKDGHIDPDLFDLFLTSGVYREYADRFLGPEQLDDVDVEGYLG
ncbi:HD domain-containing phosphohydrolase [Magnetovibrio sp. PR-2]|uniref:HD domain-containing phosphohydrolase n=1 Tax=Magnetovibrio sp. PR-2 TaxID=3120356 RepID=UPI002FCDEE20